MKHICQLIEIRHYFVSWSRTNSWYIFVTSFHYTDSVTTVWTEYKLLVKCTTNYFAQFLVHAQIRHHPFDDLKCSQFTWQCCEDSRASGCGLNVPRLHSTNVPVLRALKYSRSKRYRVRVTGKLIYLEQIISCVYEMFISELLKAK